MMGWIARIFMAVAGLITGWFMAKDAAAFGVAQAIVAMFLVVFVVLIFIVWPPGRPGKSP